MKIVIGAVSAIFLVASSSYSADILPVKSGQVTSRVGWRVDPFGSGKMVYHRGIDIAVPVGTAVFPTAGGKVIHAGHHGAHGQTVVLRHADGSETLYGHNSSVRVAVGQTVDTATVIAFSGNSGRSTGPHVHYEVRGRMKPGQMGEEVVVASTAVVPKIAQVIEAEKKMQELADSIKSTIYGFNTPGPSGAEDGRS